MKGDIFIAISLFFMLKTTLGYDVTINFKFK